MAARLLRAASAALGDAAGRWVLLAGPRAAAGGLRESRVPGRGAEPGLGSGAAATRTLSVSARARSSSEDKVTVHFINRDGETLTTKGKVGDSLLDVVVENNLDIDGFGACEGTLACSTCHLIFEQHIFEKLEAISDEENDMLDLAYGLTDRITTEGIWVFLLLPRRGLMTSASPSTDEANLDSLVKVMTHDLESTALGKGQEGSLQGSQEVI
ncbi:adrenodoxin, mitochondrial isoform X2 [Camelus dromedarius]|uniref:adrenodoxin, mitochondrial isoform X2 n=1 Tax=Camelus dromedarius TaxID=9838 RepID=UPI00311A0943